MTQRCMLVLENGAVFRGKLAAPLTAKVGEVVFNTSMTGYQEIVSDPSYAGQIVVMTAPQIGNTGVTAEDMESAQSHCAGLVVREFSPLASNWRSEGSLQSFLAKQEVAGMEGCDTRAITRVLRKGGSMRGLIADAEADVDAVLAKVRNAPSMKGLDLASAISSTEPSQPRFEPWIHQQDSTMVLRPEIEFKVAVYDFGVKRSILRQLRAVGCETFLFPSSAASQELLAIKPDAVLLSNGPGDPSSMHGAVESVREIIKAKVPVWGICLGHQILAQALGATTFKLPFGHHGGNHPVLDLETKKVEITAQNHGFAVEENSLPASLRCTHRNLYDLTVAGICTEDERAWGIQYHPEAGPGPGDSAYLFQRFASRLRAHRACE